jgi:uncharacterized protein YjbJ (UPF0337 family)
MINQTMLKGNWNELKGQIRKHWGQLSGDDLQSFDGNIDQLVGLIQRKTGETRSAVEDYLNNLTENGAASISAAADTARQYVQDAAHKIQDGSRQAADSLRQRYEDAEEMVRQRPSESVAVSFGIGVFVGLLFGLTLRGR